MYIEGCLHNDCGLILQRLLNIQRGTIISAIIATPFLSNFEVRGIDGRRVRLVFLFEYFEAILDATVAERVAAVWQQNWHSLAIIVNLGAQGALNFFNVHYL